MNFLLQTTPAFPSSVKSTNPFDFNDETTQVQAPVVRTFGLLFLTQVNGSFSPLPECILNL